MVMPRNNDFITTDYYHSSISFEQLQAVHRVLAKRTNTRIRRLKTAKMTTKEGFLIDVAAGKFITSALEEQGRRFFSESKTYLGKEKQGSLAERRQTILSEIGEMQRFLTMKSSTPGGWSAIEKKRIATFTGKGLGEAAKDPEFYKFLNSMTYENLMKWADSGQVQKLWQLKELQIKDSDKVQELFEEYSKKKDQTWQGLLDYLKVKELPDSENV